MDLEAAPDYTMEVAPETTRLAPTRPYAHVDDMTDRVRAMPLGSTVIVGRRVD